MKNTLFSGAVCVWLLVAANGCATVSRGDKQTVKFLSDPPAAKIVVDGHPYVTPADIIIKRKGEHEITVSKEGYQTILFKLKAKWDAGGVGAVALDAAVPGGSVMFLIDTIAGADREYSKVVTIKLPPAAAGTMQPITLYEYKGKLMSKPEFDAAVEKDKLFKSKKSSTQPAAKPTTP